MKYFVAPFASVCTVVVFIASLAYPRVVVGVPVTPVQGTEFALLAFPERFPTKLGAVIEPAVWKFPLVALSPAIGAAPCLPHVNPRPVLQASICILIE